MYKSIISTIFATVLCVSLLLFCACAKSDENERVKYNLTIVDDSNLLIEPLDESYDAGETVTVVTKSDVVATIDGTCLLPTVTDENGAWKFTFTMPNKNSALELKSEIAAIPPQSQKIANAIAYYDLVLTHDSQFTGFKMNAYVHSLSVWNEIKPLVPNFESNYDEKFFESNALLVFFGEKGHGANGKIESVEVLLRDKQLTVVINAETLNPDDGAPAVMTEWVVILEIENNIYFTDLNVETNI